jgi:hypothetical protein
MLFSQMIFLLLDWNMPESRLQQLIVHRIEGLITE